MASKGLLTIMGWVAVGATLVATSGLTGAASSRLLLLSGALIGLALTTASRRS